MSDLHDWMKQRRAKMALESICERKEISEIIAIEPGVVSILALASDPEPRENRWISYEALKRMSDGFVGDGARTVELQTPEHYMALMSAIDDLLPRPYEDEERRRRDEYA